MTTPGLLIVPITTPCIDNAFQPVSGATLKINIAGGSTLASLFLDAGLTEPAENPQTSDASGRFFLQSTTLWADASQTYDATLTFPDGETFTFDSLPVLEGGVNLSGLAPIHSPIFTGNPQAPTPALNDNSNSLATTAYVQGQNYAPLA